jgi:hypothetical protein
MQTLHPLHPLRIRLIPSTLTGSGLIHLRKLHSESRLQSSFKKPQLQKLLSLDKQRKRQVTLRWKEFFTRARAIRNEGSRDRDLKKRVEKEPVDIFDTSRTTLNALDETFEKIEKEESYNFPRDDDPTLRAACEALSHALQKANNVQADHDTPEVKQALNNLRKVYDEAAESNTISMRYIDVEPPYVPFSPLMSTVSLERILLARPWVKELITEVRDKSLGRQILVVGEPGSGESYLTSNGLPQFSQLICKPRQERYPCRIPTFLPHLYGRPGYPPDGKLSRYSGINLRC